MRILEFTTDDSQNQPITQGHIDALEKGLDKLYATNNIDFNFTKHFIDRVNDPRNKNQITIKELVHIFVEVQKKHGQKLENTKELQAVMKDLSTDVNAPFVLEYNPRTRMLQLYIKSVMRKHNFGTSNPVLTVEDWEVDKDYRKHWTTDRNIWNKAVYGFHKRNKLPMKQDAFGHTPDSDVSYIATHGTEVARWFRDESKGYVLADAAYKKDAEQNRKEYGRKRIADIKKMLDKPKDDDNGGMAER